MKKGYITIKKASELYGISDRTLRYFVSARKDDNDDVYLDGKTWYINKNSDLIKDYIEKNKCRKNSSRAINNVLNALKKEKNSGMHGGLYHKTQIELAYNSNHIEGSKLTKDETRYIFETKTIGSFKKNETKKIDDIIETINHFRCFDYILDKAKYKLSEHLIKNIHLILKQNTSDSEKEWFNVGEYKKLPNEVGGVETTKPEKVSREMKNLIARYEAKSHMTIEDIIDFHYQFENIHPFQDGNGRVGRLIMFKECLRYNVVPFIIEDDVKLYYYRGLKEWKSTKGHLLDTCFSMQDKYKTWLDYFGIKFNKK